MGIFIDMKTLVMVSLFLLSHLNNYQMLQVYVLLVEASAKFSAMLFLMIEVACLVIIPSFFAGMITLVMGSHQAR